MLGYYGEVEPINSNLYMEITLIDWTADYYGNNWPDRSHNTAAPTAADQRDYWNALTGTEWHQDLQKLPLKEQLDRAVVHQWNPYIYFLFPDQMDQ